MVVSAVCVSFESELDDELNVEERETPRWVVFVVVVRVGLVGWRAARAEEDLRSGFVTFWNFESL